MTDAMAKGHKNTDKVDFSKSGINKEVLRTTIEHPAVLYPGAIGVLGMIGTAIFGADLLLLTAAIGGATAAALSWGANFSFFRDKFAKKHVERLTKMMEERRRARIAKLGKVLEEVDAREGLSQFKRLSDKFNTFHAMLDSKLEPGELTHARYLGIAEQVYLSALDNLHTLANTQKSIGVIDADYVQERLKTIDENGARDPEAERERQTLQARLELRDRQLDKVQTLLAQNEEAMTQMDLTLAEITDMRTEAGRATLDMETAMAELSKLAKRAKDYSD